MVVSSKPIAPPCFSAPTAYRAMLAAGCRGADHRRCGSPYRLARPCPPLCSTIGCARPASRSSISARPRYCTFISNRLDDLAPVPLRPSRIPKPGSSTRRWPSRRAARSELGPRSDRLSLLADPRQLNTCARAGTLTGDQPVQDEAGYRFHFSACSDDMIISAGYNVADRR